MCFAARCGPDRLQRRKTMRQGDDLPVYLGLSMGDRITVATVTNLMRSTAAQDEVVSVQAELARTETALEQRTAALLAAQVRIQEVEQAQAAGEATRRALEAEIARQQDEIGARDRALVQARADFSGELNTTT
jgi:hypothetical protein